MENKEINEVTEAVYKVLLEKNKRYGNSALSPLNIFYQGDSATSIAIRLDDKISRVINSDTLRKNDMFDILGYLILYSISMEYYNTDKYNTLEDNLAYIDEAIKCYCSHFDYDFGCFMFNKTPSSVDYIDCVIRSIKQNGVNEDYLMMLIRMFISYFQENNITDFSDLID